MNYAASTHTTDWYNDGARVLQLQLSTMKVLEENKTACPKRELQFLNTRKNNIKMENFGSAGSPMLQHGKLTIFNILNFDIF